MRRVLRVLLTAMMVLAMGSGVVVLRPADTAVLADWVCVGSDDLLIGICI